MNTPGSLMARLGFAADTHASDAELLARFRHERDEMAFAELVRRHGPMVFAVCRRVLTHWHDAEDAFQAAFLVLACKPDAARPPERLGAWLHGVACRIAQQARRAENRHRARETRVRLEQPVAFTAPPPDDRLRIIDTVLLGLPERYRAAVVVCDLEGLSRKEAAARLGWSEGLLSGRLARARKLLADRLARRGVALSLGGLGVALGAPAAVARELTASTLAVTRLAVGGLDTLPAGPVAILAHEVTRSMLPIRFGLLAAILGLSLCATAFATQLLPVASAIRPVSPPLWSPGAAVRVRVAAPEPVPVWRERCHFDQGAAVSALVMGKADQLYAGGTNGSLILWDIGAKKELAAIINGAKGVKAIDSLEIHPAGEWLYVTHDDRHRLISFTLNNPRGYLGNGRGGVTFFGTLPDGRALITGDPSDAKRIVFISQAFPKNEAAVPDDLKHKADVQFVAAANEELVVTVTADSAVHAWEVDRGKLRWSASFEKLDPAALAVSHNGTGIAVASKNGTVRVLDPKTGKVNHELTGHGTVHALAFSGDGKKLATAGADKLLRVWNPATGKETAVLKGHTDEVRCVLFDSDGTVIVSGGADKMVRVWELKP